MLPAGRAEFLTTFVFPPPDSSAGGFTGGHALLLVYVGTAPGPDVSGGLSHILLRPVQGCFHPEQKTLVNDAHSALVASEMAPRHTREDGIEPWPTQALHVPVGDAGYTELQSSGMTHVPGVAAGTQCHQVGGHHTACLCERLNTPKTAYLWFTCSSKKILPY